MPALDGIAPPAGTLLPLRIRASIVAAATAAAVFTLLVSVTSVIALAYRSPALHVATETAAALISLVAAQLIYGRFRSTLRLSDLCLTAALFVFAVSNLCFSAIPAIAQSPPGLFQTWAPVGGQLLGAALLAAAPFIPPRLVHRPRRSAMRTLGACAVALACIAAAVVLAGDRLPEAIEPGLSPTGSERPSVVGQSTVLGEQLMTMLFFTVAAFGYSRRAERTDDELDRWLAIASTLGAFSRLNYVLFPSLFSEWFYAGDVLRLAFYLALLVGGVLELRRTYEALATAAVFGERQRLARDLHDGVAQDLAFIVQHGRKLARQDSGERRVQPLITAAQSALDESRHAIAALARPRHQSLAEALRNTAREAADREGAEVETDIPAELVMPAAREQALLRVVREATLNAVRHGGARMVRIELREMPCLCLRVTDDGTGFDVSEAAEAPGRMGLKGMAERIRDVGGEFSIDSEPGHPTCVTVAFR
jgi:signal transduction histidine kinase